MKKLLLILFFAGFFVTSSFDARSQCSICNKTVQQMGSKPASGFNAAIIYLMIIPYAAIGIIGYRWWKSDKGRAAD